MIVGWFTVVYAIFRFSQEKVLHLPWAIRVTFCKYFLNNFFFFSIIDSILLYLKGTQKNSVWIHTPSWCHWYTKNFWNFHLEVSGFLSGWRKAASIKEIQKFHFQCSFLSQEYQEVYSGSLLFPYNCPILTTCISSWTRAMVIVNWPIFFNLRLRASHF